MEREWCKLDCEGQRHLLKALEDMMGIFSKERTKCKDRWKEYLQILRTAF